MLLNKIDKIPTTAEKSTRNQPNEDAYPVHRGLSGEQQSLVDVNFCYCAHDGPGLSLDWNQAGEAEKGLYGRGTLKLCQQKIVADLMVLPVSRAALGQQ